MKFRFTTQQYQLDAVNAVADVFKGQPLNTDARYTPDPGVGNILVTDYGYRNADITLSDADLLSNIRAVQNRNMIPISPALDRTFGRVSLDIDMETGTGKTYVYTRLMFELYRRYGWGKYIVVTPSIAIREGVKKSFDVTEEHFMEEFSDDREGAKCRMVFIYSSANIGMIDQFSSNSGINVMIINTQAFAASLDEDKYNAGKGTKESRIIYTQRDSFGSRRPIDVLAANRPILILDEPQRMGKTADSATQKAIKRFAPLFTVNCSATHTTRHNLVYALDAADAYQHRLVKQIEVTGVEVTHLKGTGGYLYLDRLITSPKKRPSARIEIETKPKGTGGIRRSFFTFDIGDSLYTRSGELTEYEGLVITDIDPFKNEVTFQTGDKIAVGQVAGDENERDIRRVQIRETILSHFEKEARNFARGIKTLSLFFIDEVAKYRIYNDDGTEGLGEYGRIFEEEYRLALNERLEMQGLDKETAAYQAYLRAAGPTEVHRGYFSIDKKGRSVDSAPRRGSDMSDDISAYDLILKNKERLLSFEEPTRFIFSHSALREGWDNPNVFQICTLKRSSSETGKRQEVGRGLRLCVDQDGARMDTTVLEDDVHKVNQLTVIASESYATFVGELQSDLRAHQRARPREATVEYFTGKVIQTAEGGVELTKPQATAIMTYMHVNGYADRNGHVTEKYHADSAKGALAPFPDEDLAPIALGIHEQIRSIFDEKVFTEMAKNSKRSKQIVRLNSNFDKPDFQTLWSMINHKYVFAVEFDSEALISGSIEKIDKDLTVTEMKYKVTKGRQSGADEFEQTDVKNLPIARPSLGATRYDLVGSIAKNCGLTRRTIGRIVTGVRLETLYKFRTNPEEFIARVSSFINEKKRDSMRAHISYTETSGKFPKEIFYIEKSPEIFEDASRFTETPLKNVQDYVFQNSEIERDFAIDLEAREEVCVYAKLPLGYTIPTPAGNYSPDWAIAFREGSVKHIYFVAETKGTNVSEELRHKEEYKIDCAKALFGSLLEGKVKYDFVNSLDELMDRIS